MIFGNGETDVAVGDDAADAAVASRADVPTEWMGMDARLLELEASNWRALAAHLTDILIMGVDQADDFRVGKACFLKTKRIP